VPCTNINEIIKREGRLMDVLKLYILARKDAPIGKVMAHVGHVCCLIMQKRLIINDWINNYDQTKIILEVKNEDELIEFNNTKLLSNIPFYKYTTISDVHTNEIYCLAIGPLTNEEAKELGLKRLKLYRGKKCQ